MGIRVHALALLLAFSRTFLWPGPRGHDAVSLHGLDAYLARLRSQTYIDLYLSALHAERMRLADFSQQTRGGAK